MAIQQQGFARLLISLTVLFSLTMANAEEILPVSQDVALGTELSGQAVNITALDASLENTPTLPDNVPLTEQVQDIKGQILDLNKDLFILEEELLFPANTQLSVYVSLDIGEYFSLDAVKLSVDGKVVSSYLYTEKQIDALKRGGIQQLYKGNVRNGEHEIVAVFTGLGPNGEDYRRASQLVFDKDGDAKHIELKIIDSEAHQRPEFVIKEW